MLVILLRRLRTGEVSGRSHASEVTLRTHGGVVSKLGLVLLQERGQHRVHDQTACLQRMPAERLMPARSVCPQRMPAERRTPHARSVCPQSAPDPNPARRPSHKATRPHHDCGTASHISNQMFYVFARWRRDLDPGAKGTSARWSLGPMSHHPFTSRA